MASSVSAPVVMSQATKRTHAEMTSSEMLGQQNQTIQSSLQAEMVSSCASIMSSSIAESKAVLEPRVAEHGISKIPARDPVLNNSNASHDLHPKENATTMRSEAAYSGDTEQSLSDTAKITSETVMSSQKFTDGGSHPVEATKSFNGISSDTASAFCASNMKETKNAVENVSLFPASKVSVNTSQVSAESSVIHASGPEKSALEPVTTAETADSQDNRGKATEISLSKSFSTNSKSSSEKLQLECGEQPEKKAKVVPSVGKGGGRTPEQILEYMDKTFEQRRKIITKQMPSIPELKELYPDLFMGKQLLLEFQRITKIDIDQKIQEFCVRYATAVIEMARNKKAAAPVLARWEQAKLENDTLKQYWDMVTALCLLPLHFGENFVEMVLEIGEDDEVVAQGKIVPTLVARGNIFRTDEFFLIAENTIVQEFEEFTIAFASLYSSYWVFNMVYPETIDNTYNYIQRCIVRQREPGSIPPACKNFTKTLLKWNKGKDGK